MEIDLAEFLYFSFLKCRSRDLNAIPLCIEIIQNIRDHPENIDFLEADQVTDLQNVDFPVIFCRKKPHTPPDQSLFIRETLIQFSISSFDQIEHLYQNDEIDAVSTVADALHNIPHMCRDGRFDRQWFLNDFMMLQRYWMLFDNDFKQWVIQIAGEEAVQWVQLNYPQDSHLVGV